MQFVFSGSFVMAFMVTVLSNMGISDLQADTLPMHQLELPAVEPVLRFQSDYELTRSLVEQTQAQLGDFELLADEYERFQELEDRLNTQRDNRELASALIKSAQRIQDVLKRRHLREFFSPEFVKQVDFFAELSSPRQEP